MDLGIEISFAPTPVCPFSTMWFRCGCGATHFPDGRLLMERVCTLHHAVAHLLTGMRFL